MQFDEETVNALRDEDEHDDAVLSILNSISYISNNNFLDYTPDELMDMDKGDLVQIIIGVHLLANSLIDRIGGEALFAWADAEEAIRHRLVIDCADKTFELKLVEDIVLEPDNA